ncbi:GNAT family acetyltransferase [Desulfovibrio ferrophilus]|uniref:Acetyltransferase n=1 Tax=Desulfovibrio ferrophilus TaxID=241368 RepID=A0A2Z6B3G7_9BACT|nr:GNAT family acetyltransferase [Desulfovibrio ferrophilus]BBD10042.1 acetyltransferase [Desulfovibrio ferrophilus]
MKAKIRIFQEGDQEPVIGLWRDCGLVVPWNDPAKDIQRKLEDSPELFLVAETEGFVAGSCMAGYDGHRGWIFYMAVQPDQQGCGIARALLDHAETVLKERGCPKVELMVRDTNTKVLEFYRHLGYSDEPVKVLGKRLIPDE